MSAIRRGLPRVPGGEPWPPAREAPAHVVAASVEDVTTADAVAGSATAVGSPRGDVPLRRGLPRVAGGESWPAEGFAPHWVVSATDAAQEAAQEAAREAAGVEPEAAVAEDAPVLAGPAPTRSRLHPHARRALMAAAALVVVGALAVLVSRWFLGTDAGEGFVADHPGTYPLPADAPVGIPAWLSWTHFFNVFLMVLIVRTGLQVRRQTRPPAYWTSRTEPTSRIGLPSWTHQALDVFWVLNGVVYIVMLFATGQWMRIVPTSWEVLPGAVSTTLQYLSLDWPAENGWVYYNSLQQIVYFLTVFVAAPLAIATGVRMSLYWRGGERWDRLYPASVARKLHFPVMIYFVAFVVGHVALVLATGARENLNHMYAGRDDVSWVGVGIFALSLVVIVAAAVALRPVFVAPVAGKFGTVSSR
ncbi:cytochrome b/b6 domain-containing protein [Demequina sp. NBRC 110051]|uniref:cytochrome b/b6 domain-containing protein n=1 Tax=Demequina sp. NBRC 110051 TaxID=1570340 RepID=UPI000A02839D|nr:cytochrome b/b6 domain-containing protein [Demequina sp. NBRC 110051]